MDVFVRRHHGAGSLHVFERRMRAEQGELRAEVSRVFAAVPLQSQPSQRGPDGDALDENREHHHAEGHGDQQIALRKRLGNAEREHHRQRPAQASPRKDGGPAPRKLEALGKELGDRPRHQHARHRYDQERDDDQAPAGEQRGKLDHQSDRQEHERVEHERDVVPERRRADAGRGRHAAAPAAPAAQQARRNRRHDTGGTDRLRREKEP